MPKDKVKPDTALKAYWRRSAEFADFFNAALFDGKPVIDASVLEERDTESSVILETDTYAEGLPSARDLFKVAMKADGVELALLGLENELGIHYAMPLRDLGYFYDGYEKQYEKIKEKYPKKKGLESWNEVRSNMKKTDKFLPVVNVVLYYGEQPWDGPRTLLDMTDVPDWFRPVAQDYRMILVEVCDNDLVFHNENNINLFSLFKLLYDRKKTAAEKRAEVERYENEHEVDKSVALAIASTSKVNMEAYKEKGDFTVCTLFDEIAKENKEQGMEQGKLETLAGLVKKGILTLQQAADERSLTVDDFKKQCVKYNLTL